LAEISKLEKIKNIKKACKLTDEAFLFVKHRIKAGQTEKQAAKIIDQFIKKNGAKLAFKTIVSFGKNTANIHHNPTDKILRNGQPIMLDFGAKFDGYCSDLTRMIFLKSISQEFKNIYNLVLTAQDYAIKSLVNGLFLGKEMRGDKIDAVAREVIKKAGYGKYFPHGLGHGLDVKIHNRLRLQPNFRDILKAGDVVTIEPGIYIKGKGGVRIEDDVLIKNGEIEVLTKAFKKLEEVII